MKEEALDRDSQWNPDLNYLVTDEVWLGVV